MIRGDSWMWCLTSSEARALTVKRPEEEAETCKRPVIPAVTAARSQISRCPCGELKGLPEDLVLAEEPGEAGNARDGEAGDKERPVGDGGPFSAGRHVSHIQLAAHGVHDAPRPKKRRPLKKAWVNQVEDAGRIGSDAHGDEHEPELADGGVGQDLLDVVLGKSRSRRRKRR